MEKNHSQTEKFEFVAKTFYGLEPILAKEIEKIGGENVEVGNRMVKFTGDKVLLYKANIYLRTALRILKPVFVKNISTQADLYELLSKIDWEDFLGLHHTFAIDAVVHSTIFKNSHFVAQRAKDAIVDNFKKKYHERPVIDVKNPDVLINLHLSGNQLTLSLDSSGESLHKRGYREAEGAAPINQVLAAAMILFSGWDYNQPFYDLMTGSGTIAIEAAMIARNIPPGLVRKTYCFQNWPDYDKKLYRSILEDVELNDVKPQIFANDISEEVLEIARTNALKANVTSFIRFSNKSYVDYRPRKKDGVVMVNPPYGERIELEEVISFYQQIGDVFKNKYAGFKAWVISSNFDAMKHIGLKPSKKMKLFNGGLECLFAQYDIFDGKHSDYKKQMNAE